MTKRTPAAAGAKPAATAAAPAVDQAATAEAERLAAEQAAAETERLAAEFAANAEAERLAAEHAAAAEPDRPGHSMMVKAISPKGRRRSGIAFGQEAQRVYLDDLTSEQIEAIISDDQLVVQLDD